MAVFTVQLDDKVSAPAESAAAAVGSLSEQFEALQKQLSAVEQMQQNALKFHDKNAYKPASEQDILKDVRAQQNDTLNAYASAAEAAHGRAAAAAAKELDQIQALQKANLARADAERDAAQQTAETSKWFSDLTASGEEMSPTLDALALKAEKFAGALAIGVAIITAYAAALSKLASMAIAFSQEDDALRTTLGVLAGGGDALGQEIMDQLDALAEGLPFATGKLEVWAKGLLAAGIKGDALSTSIKAIAAATAIMGEKGGAAAETLIKRFAMMADAGQKVTLDRRIMQQMADAGVTVADLSKALGVPADKLAGMALDAKKLGEAMQQALIAKGVGPLQRMGQTFGSMKEKITDAFEDAFANLGDLVRPFMAQLQSLASEFFKGGIASNDFASVIKAVLTPAFEVATEMVRWLHKGFLHLQIAVLQVRIALKPVTSALGEIGISGGIVNVALYVLKGTVIVLAVVFGLLAVAVALVALPFVVLGLAIYGVYRAITFLIANIGSIGDTLAGIGQSAVNAGVAFIQGLGGAISAGAPWVIGLVTQLAAGIIAAIVGPLAIRSPSRVMAQIGGYTTEGLAQGITSGTPAVQAAAQGAGMATISGVQQGTTQGGGAPVAKGGKGGVTIERGAVTVTVNGADGENIGRLVEEAFAVLLERLAAKAGL